MFAQPSHSIGWLAEHGVSIAAGVPHLRFSQHPGRMGPQVCDGNAVAEQALELIGQPQFGVG